MGNLVRDTTITETDEEGCFRGTVAPAWEIWGPAGGFVAGMALRAAGAVSRFPRPATCSVHFLGVAAFAPVDLHVEIVKATRRTESIRVLMTQDERPILQLICWAVTEETLDKRHRHGTFPHPAHDTVPTVEERVAAAGVDPDAEPPRYRFWDNFDQRPLQWVDDWDARPVLDPVWQTWLRFREEPTSADPWMEAARLLLLVDLGGWPAAHRAHPPDEDDAWYAPSLDVSCQFVDLVTSEWLCVEHVSPAAAGGLLHATGTVWADDGRLLATGITQLLATPTRR